MSGLVIPFTLLKSRRNPARIGHRNLRIVQGEDITLVVTVYNTDTDTAPLNADFTDSVTLNLFRDTMGDRRHYGCGLADYGWGYDVSATPVLSIVGTVPVVNGVNALGVVWFVLTDVLTAPLGGRYKFFIFNDNALTSSVKVFGTGIMEVEGSPWAQPGVLGQYPSNSGTYYTPSDNPAGYYVPSPVVGDGP